MVDVTRGSVENLWFTIKLASCLYIYRSLNEHQWSIRVLNLGFGFKTKPPPSPFPTWRNHGSYTRIDPSSYLTPSI